MLADGYHCVEEEKGKKTYEARIGDMSLWTSSEPEEKGLEDARGLGHEFRLRGGALAQQEGQAR